MWCVLEERATSQSVVTPPSIIVTDLKKLELDVKVYFLYEMCANLLQHLIASFSAICIEGDIRLGVKNFTEFYITTDDFEDYYFIKDELARGRIEVCLEGQYGTICDSDWYSNAAAVVCFQLGFSRYG